MKRFLDANICIDFIRGKSEEIRSRFRSMNPDDFSVPVIVQAELLTGAAKSMHPEQSQKMVKAFLEPFEIAFFDSAMAETYAEIRASTEKTGWKVGPNDLFIAATVMTLGGILVTRNIREFSNIPGLKLEVW